MKTYQGAICELEKNQIAVCGTNTQGRSGAGFARWCVMHAGLRYGHTVGLCGNTYAIITKDLREQSHPSISRIKIMEQISQLYKFAKSHPELEFLVPYDTSHKNLNGYSAEDMARMFSEAGEIPDNFVFEKTFSKLLKNEI